MPSLRDTGRLGVAAADPAAELLAASSFVGDEPVRLPFDVQRSRIIVGLAIFGVCLATGVAVGIRPIAAIGLVVAVACALVAAMNQRLGLGILVALVPATSGLVRGMPVPGLRVSEAVIALVAGTLLLTARRSARWSLIDWTAVTYALAAFALGAWGPIRRSESISFDDLGLLLGPVQFFLLYRAVVVNAQTGEERAFVIRMLLYASVPVALLAVAQRLGFPGAVDLVTKLTGTRIFGANAGDTARATGPFPHWHNLGGYELMILLIGLGSFLRRIPGLPRLTVFLPIIGLNVLALLLTVSLAPIAAFVAGAILLGVWLGGLSRMLLLLAGAVLVAALFFAPTFEARYRSQFDRAPGTDRSAFVPQTVEYRYELWTTELIPRLGDDWLVGYGPKLPPELDDFPYTESLYIGLLYRGGLILLLAWLALTGAMALGARRSMQLDDPVQQAVGASLLAALIVLMFVQVLQPYFTTSGTPHLLWVLVGLLAVRGLEPALPRTAADFQRLS